MCADDDDGMGTSSGPAHLLKLVHAPVDQSVCQALGRGGADRLTLPIPEAVIYQVSRLPFDIVPELAHCGLLPLGRDRRSRPRDADIKRAEQLGYPFDRVVRAIDVAVPEPPMQAVEGFGDKRFGARFGVRAAAQTFGRRFGDLYPPRQMGPVENWRRCEASLFQISPEHLVAISECCDVRGVAMPQALERSLDQRVRTVFHADDSADFNASALLVGAHPDQDFVMPRTGGGGASDKGCIDPKVDGARGTLSIRHQCIGFALDLRCPTQGPPSRRIGGAAFSEREEITNDLLRRAEAHKRTETTSDLIIIGGRPGRAGDETRSRKARSRPHKAGNPNDKGSEQSLHRARPIVFEHQARISPPEQQRLGFQKSFLQTYHGALDCPEDTLRRIEAQSNIVNSDRRGNFANVANHNAPARSGTARFDQFKPPSHQNPPVRQRRDPPKSPDCPQDPHVWNSPRHFLRMCYEDPSKGVRG